MTRISAIIPKIKDAVTWLKEQNTNFRVIIKQTRNLGDTLHITPIARHYKTVYPDCKIVFLVGDSYASVYKFNKDFDLIVPIPSSLNPQERIKIGQWMKANIHGIDKVLCPSIFPFAEVWPSHVWSYPKISHQYFANAGIKPNEMQGGSRLSAPVSPEDVSFAKSFLGNGKFVGIEYNSYSHPVPWKGADFAKLASYLHSLGYKCISFAGLKEGKIDNTIDGRGMTWRRTIAVLSRCELFIGVGSGITMLAACASPMPRIIEIGVSDSISMSGCGYADSKCFKRATPKEVYEYIKDNK